MIIFWLLRLCPEEEKTRGPSLYPKTIWKLKITILARPKFEVLHSFIYIYIYIYIYMYRERERERERAKPIKRIHWREAVEGLNYFSNVSLTLSLPSKSLHQQANNLKNDV